MLIETFWSKSSMELSPKFHGTFWTTFEQHLWFHGIPWNSMEFCPDPKFHGIPWNFFHTPEFHGIPWNSMELLVFPQKVPWNSMEFHGIPWNFFWSSMEFHGIPWNLINFIFKKIIFLNIVFGIWLMIRCYLAKISQKRYKLHWFQYRNSYFEHPSVSENGTRSAKMACCLNQCRLKVNWGIWDKLMSNLNQHPIIFIQENAFETTVCKMAAILCLPQALNVSDPLGPWKTWINFNPSMDK